MIKPRMEQVTDTEIPMIAPLESGPPEDEAGVEDVGPGACDVVGVGETVCTVVAEAAVTVLPFGCRQTA